MKVAVLRAADRKAVPWKNGGGVTREVAAWPPGSGFDDFAWRISMAEVREDGPFSSFPGVDRILTVLEGGLRLAVVGAGAFDLSPVAPPLAFDGEAPAVATLMSESVLDLNVMTRRGVATASVTHVTSDAEIPLSEGMCLVLALADEVRVACAGDVRALSRHDGVLTSAGVTIQATTDASAIVVLLKLYGGDA